MFDENFTKSVYNSHYIRGQIYIFSREKDVSLY